MKINSGTGVIFVASDLNFELHYALCEFERARER